MSAGNRAWQSGFTLIETLVMLTMVAVLVMIVVPGFQHLMKSNRETSTEIAIRSGLNIARSEAIKRRTTALLIMNKDAALQVQTQSEILRQINLVRQVALTLPDGAIIFTSLGRLAVGSGNKICAAFEDGNGLRFELSQAGGLTVQKMGACDG
ncbi:hypothetical protein GCM10027040_00730 [Halomonas shantousis]